MEAITATYVQDDADWTITVSGRGKTLTGHAPGIIAARDMADQLAERLAPDEPGRTVVHLLNGSALDFTAAYIEARMSRTAANEAPEPPAQDEPAGAEAPAEEKQEAEASVPAQPAKGTKPEVPKQTPKKPKRAKAAKRPAKQAPKDDSSEHPEPAGSAEEAVPAAANQA
ncbi:hypothetical protein [Thermocrispum municipale]|jgi:hypothetical protein|uniref:hypothetical protein n=1 Tax=Thermocrispum municipale TaxID=37926 RepID=UPI00040A1A1B|nr:hypothetical protein [Thermocrispum municipale]